MGVWHPLRRGFYSRDSAEVALDVLGRVLVHESSEGQTSGIIVEAEAYYGEDDPASHAYRGMTERNRVMFGEPGHAYIFLLYGINHLLNVVTMPEGVPGAVLLRALQPLEGMELMSRRRGISNPLLLASGPGRLSKAMGIDLSHNGIDMTRPPLYISRRKVLANFEVVRTPRIGVKDKRPLRFYMKNNPYVSKPKA
jgi:DNA-3-methyladenine glycosylase